MNLPASSQAAELASGKGHNDENFPVASFILHPRHRAPIMAFYRFARAADDVADNPAAPADEKLALLAAMQSGLQGAGGISPEGEGLRHALRAANLTDQHALDLLEAFRRDVVKTRYASWDELMDYCRYSAMPVGRFVLDVHGESHRAWPANDALCAALQVINHLQDCGEDYRGIDRVYVPGDALAAAGLDARALAAPRASPALQRVISDLARRTWSLLETARPFAGQIVDGRLALEVTVIQKLAESLTRRLIHRDPLSERMHHSKAETLGVAALAFGGFLGALPGRRRRAQRAIEAAQ
ncbi:MAG TPA: squalene synthase HpnC [Caulobacteraceae bacterium]|jgi:squalene synthase HpnC|nr:squalene synthase HpnC [Caulobacteraceae bacterium]